MLCWHQLVIRGRLSLCRHCGVQVEPCPCVRWRDADPKCELCLGSGWLAVVRSEIEKFREYVDRHRDLVIK